MAESPIHKPNKGLVPVKSLLGYNDGSLEKNNEQFKTDWFYENGFEGTIIAFDYVNCFFYEAISGEVRWFDIDLSKETEHANDPLVAPNYKAFIKLLIDSCSDLEIKQKLEAEYKLLE